MGVKRANMKTNKNMKNNNRRQQLN